MFVILLVMKSLNVFECFLIWEMVLHLKNIGIFIIHRTVGDICNSIFSLNNFNRYYNKTFNLNEFYNQLHQNLKINMSLFSITNHFLRCVKSCDKVSDFPSYCALCFRIENFYLNFLNFFEDIKISKNNTTLLGLDPSNVIDLDVFVAKTDDYEFYLRETDELSDIFLHTRYICSFFFNFIKNLFEFV